MEKVFDLKGRTALVTGSSRGIGRAIALKLAEHGAGLVVHCGGNAEAAAKVAEEAEAFGVKAHVAAMDLAEPDAPRRLRDMVKKLVGGIDILVLNASVQHRRNWLEVTGEEFDSQVVVNLKASLGLMQLFVPAMMDKGWGRILTIGSVQQTRPHPEMIVYSATKAAQMSMVMTVAREVACAGVTVNNLSPGVIETDRNREALADCKYMRQRLSLIPCGFFGKPSDCAAAALLLCSEEGRYITGIDLPVDGGRHLA